MEVKKYLDLIHLAENLKNSTRHCKTSSGRDESVAEHCWRISFMAYFLKDELPDADIDKVIKMCIFHDIGEAFTGDIPTFIKNFSDEKTEENAVNEWLDSLGEPYGQELRSLFDEMKNQTSIESKIFKALDKIEAVIQHNESDISTWLELEYELQMTYGKKECEFSPFFKKLREQVENDTVQKIGGGA